MDRNFVIMIQLSHPSTIRVRFSDSFSKYGTYSIVMAKRLFLYKAKRSKNTPFWQVNRYIRNLFATSNFRSKPNLIGNLLRMASSSISLRFVAPITIVELPVLWNPSHAVRNSAIFVSLKSDWLKEPRDPSKTSISSMKITIGDNLPALYGFATILS